MKANINKINYISDVEGYHIITEFSRLPVESFYNQQDANEFILGYRTGLDLTDSMKKGKLFRGFVESDMRESGEYEKVNEVEQHELFKFEKKYTYVYKWDDQLNVEKVYGNYLVVTFK